MSFSRQQHRDEARVQVFVPQVMFEYGGCEGTKDFTSRTDRQALYKLQ